MSTKIARPLIGARLPVTLVVLATVILHSLAVWTPAQATPSYGSITINVRQIDPGITTYWVVPSSTDYVADTLCNEWLCGWNDQALAAGAVLIRSAAFWEMSRRWDSNCHAVTVNGGYYDTTSSYIDTDNDQRYIHGSAVDIHQGKPLGIVSSIPDWHGDYNGDYVYTDYGSDIQNRTQDLSWTQNWQQIIHTIYDGRLTGSGCNPKQYLTPAIVITQT